MSESQNSAPSYLCDIRQAVTGPFLRGLAPDPIHLTVSQWADQYRFLSSKASSEPGRWQTSRTPYLREPMDSLSPSDPCDTVVMLFGSQLGKTETGLNWIGSIIDIAPGPMLMVQPTDDMSDKVVTQRLDPAIADAPQLSEKVATKKSRDGANSMNAKEFPGGILLFTGANTAAGLASMPVRYLFLDEVDRYPQDVKGEGDPVALARARTRTFGNNKKILITSTPTEEGSSRVSSEYELTDQREYYVPCPDCDEYQTLKFDRLIFEKENDKRIEGEEPTDVMYACEHCGSLIPEYKKTWMLERGEWRAKQPHRKRKKGYFLNSLYSPLGMYSWSTIAAEFMDAMSALRKTKSVALLKTFVNTVLAETWKEKGDAPDWERLYRRKADYEAGICPRGVLFLTAGVDIQRDRIELEIVGWGRGKRTWSIDYDVIPGMTNDPETWKKLWAYLERVFPVEGSSINLPISQMAVDSSDQTQMVYNEVRKISDKRVMAIKGMDNQILPVGNPRPVDIDYKGKKIARGLLMWPVGVSVIKDEVYEWLRIPQPIEDDDVPAPGYCEFPSVYSKEYFKGLTAEEKVKHVTRGRSRYQWEKKYERNEPLDCRVYSRAAAYVFGIDRFQEPDWIQLEQRLAEFTKMTHNKASKKKKHSVNPYTGK